MSLLLALALALSPVNSHPAVPDLPTCLYEDGNPDGMPCLWTNPRTGLQYYNDGSNYRD